MYINLQMNRLTERPAAPFDMSSAYWETVSAHVMDLAPF